MLRNYQIENGNKIVEILDKYSLCYLNAEVRTGKTMTALYAASFYNTNVLFVTKKKAIPSIQSDYDKLGLSYDIEIINYESVHKAKKAGVIIIDEAQSIAAFPKPSNRWKEISKLISKDTKVILMSGTMTPESYSQVYHQFTVHPNNPFSQFTNFYRWAAKYVTVKQRIINGYAVNDYSNAKVEEIKRVIDPYIITFTQEQAGFNNVIKEQILYIQMQDSTYKLCDRLISEQVIQGKDHVILADTPVKKLSKLHQLYSGTIKFECGVTKVIDRTKAEFIRQYFNGKKIAIFYKFIAEGELLREVFPNNTDKDYEFNSTDKTFIGQIVSSREGINLSTGDAIVMYNIDFSATSYWQGRDRLTTKDRVKENQLYWIFAKGGIEDYVYKVVVKKKKYTVANFKTYVRGKISKAGN